MKNQLSIFLLIVVNFSVCSQNYFTNENADNKKQSKEERKVQRSIEKANQLERVTNIVDSRRFVLEADYLSNQKGIKIPVNSSLNFIKIDSLDAVVQVGSDYGIGSNGVGGVTLEGNVNQYNVKKNDKNNSYGIRVFISALGGACDVYITVNPFGNATATVTGLFPGFLMYHGTVKSLYESKVYKAKSF